MMIIGDDHRLPRPAKPAGQPDPAGSADLERPRDPPLVGTPPALPPHVDSVSAIKLPFLATQVLTRRAAVHYESAFEDYLRTHAVPYVVADQTHRVMLANARVKGFDFLIHGGRGVNYIVDVKGRKVPDSHPGKPLAGPNWVTRDDVASLADWQRIFGASYTAMFVFAWWVSAPRGPYSAPAVSAAKPANLSGPIAPSRPPADLTHEYEGSYYCFRAIALDHYQLGLRRRSARWNTVHVSRQLFSEYSRPLGDLLGI